VRLRRGPATLLAVALLGACALGERAPIAPIEPPPAQVFERALVERGALLAAAGNCRGCHTARDGRSFAGGVGIETPFGIVYSTNITPDSETGIGAWPEAAFQRAMREGLDREGRHLYPAFPYDHFTLVSDEDNRALYAYLMTREPVRYRPPENRLAFPFNIRAGIGIWKRLYFRAGPYRPDRRGARRGIAAHTWPKGWGHCGSCHTPRNTLGAERKERAYDGGEAEGWHAYAINERSNAAVPWTEEALFMYLRRGWHDRHGISRGPMAAVTSDLAEVREDDVRAIAGYFASVIGSRPSGAPEHIAARSGPAMALYRETCHGCHDGTQPLPFGGLPLGLSIGVTGESPRNLVIVTMYGLPAAEGDATPLMPGFAGALSDRQLVDLAAALRANLTDKPPWTDLDKIVREVRAAGPRLARHPAQAADPVEAR
jgi:mono/diheme cytochrome c family protein